MANARGTGMTTKNVQALTGFIAAVASVAFAPGATAQKVQTGSFNGQTWTATSTIVGQTSTATIASGGSPLNAASMPRYSGVAALILQESAGTFICSGSLIGRQTILTAGHCVSGGNGSITPTLTTAYFYAGTNGNPATYNPDTVVPNSPLSTAVMIDKIAVNPLYTGAVIDDHDVAVLHLATAAPDFATIYGLSDVADLTGSNFNVAGYGARSDVGGYIGADLGTGRLRQGDNRYDFRLGDLDFGGAFTDPSVFGSTANYSWVSDFDNGLSRNDASCILAQDINPALTSSKFCNVGRGATEVATAGGDSGGPQFLDGKISSVTSYGLTFGSDYGDIDNSLNDSWGEFSGYASVAYNRSFIDSAVASFLPEPSSWATMIAGFAAAGTMLRRRRRVVATAAA